jgi:hypothetical protein
MTPPSTPNAWCSVPPLQRIDCYFLLGGLVDLGRLPDASDSAAPAMLVLNYTLHGPLLGSSFLLM